MLKEDDPRGAIRCFDGYIKKKQVLVNIRMRKISIHLFGTEIEFSKNYSKHGISYFSHQYKLSFLNRSEKTCCHKTYHFKANLLLTIAA